ncbi:hypothetical protein P170DRAFT_505554 [Aspergillus steynii IBT 23096]|uniref:Aromatic prenyltransferase n=1 Tax=Aspergillus steynii IBT 23096 TaxID=1392250 RepID=A0A2I2GPV5_9EURO|nr:uncharacterized protein P170DRAFT_505554 [Aspergillus steynii IBT 23096]PLB54908.1 hypothetical protein P170DRAFT_505554 [Aspergillus steynii IBT 23096]
MPEPTVKGLVSPFQLPVSASLDESEWGSILQPYLKNALVSQGQYTGHEISRHLDFFCDYVVRWLGPGPMYDSGTVKAQFPSSLTNDHTPFELSLCWKSNKQKGRPVVRYVTDVIPPNLEASRMAAFEAALTVIGTLEQASIRCASDGLDLRIFPKLWTKATKEMIEFEHQAHGSTACSRCSPSGVFVAFDLVASEAFGKLYWLFPVCLTTSEVCQGIMRTLRSCIEAEPGFSTVVSSWTKVQQYISQYPGVLQPRMLSIDTTRYPQWRVKVYVRCIFHNTNRFEYLEPHLTLGGAISPPESFQETCRSSWTSLTSQDRDDVPGIGPKYCLLMYDLPAGAMQKMSAKLYVMCQEIPRVDSFIARCLYDSCTVLQSAEIIKEMSQSSDPTAYICEIGLAPRDIDTEVSIYCSPSYSAQWSWRDKIEANGYMKKKRRVIPRKSE